METATHNTEQFWEGVNRYNDETGTRYTIAPDTDAGIPAFEYNPDTDAPREFARRVALRLSADQVQTIIANHINATYRLAERGEQVTIPETGEVFTVERVKQLQARAGDIENGDDPRMIGFWEKARRFAENAGFCEEYDRIAEALGGPARHIEWTGVQQMQVTIDVPVRIGGTCTAVEWHEGSVEPDEPDSWDVADALLTLLEGQTPAGIRYDLDIQAGDIDHDSLTTN